MRALNQANQLNQRALATAGGDRLLVLNTRALQVREVRPLPLPPPPPQPPTRAHSLTTGNVSTDGASLAPSCNNTSTTSTTNNNGQLAQLAQLAQVGQFGQMGQMGQMAQVPQTGGVQVRSLPAVDYDSITQRMLDNVRARSGAT